MEKNEQQSRGQNALGDIELSIQKTKEDFSCSVVTIPGTIPAYKWKRYKLQRISLLTITTMRIKTHHHKLHPPTATFPLQYGLLLGGRNSSLAFSKYYFQREEAA